MEFKFILVLGIIIVVFVFLFIKKKNTFLKHIISTPPSFSFKENISGRIHNFKFDIINNQVYMTFEKSLDGEIWTHLRYLVNESNNDISFKLQNLSVKFKNRDFTLFRDEQEEFNECLKYDNLLEEIANEKQEKYNSKYLLHIYRKYSLNNKIKSKIVNSPSLKQRELLSVKKFLNNKL